MEILKGAQGSLLDEEALRQSIGQTLPTFVVTRGQIAGLRQEALRSSTCYATYRVTVRLDGGQDIAVFLKDFGSYNKPRKGVDERAEREVHVYRELLALAQLGTAQYGSRLDAAAGRFWLLLECVPGTPVRYCGFPAWVAAAGWLGRMHGYFAQRFTQVTACAWLVRHDAEFFQTKAKLALEAVSCVAAPLISRATVLVSGYQKLIDVLASPPWTLLHAGYRPKNILVSADGPSLRVCPIDWEMAAIGNPLFDFASLADGFEPMELTQLCDAYQETARHSGAWVPEREAIQALVEAFRLHRVIVRLGGAVAKHYSPEQVTAILETGERVSRIVAARHPQILPS